MKLTALNGAEHISRFKDPPNFWSQSWIQKTIHLETTHSDIPFHSIVHTYPVNSMEAIHGCCWNLIVPGLSPCGQCWVSGQCSLVDRSWGNPSARRIWTFPQNSKILQNLLEAPVDAMLFFISLKALTGLAILTATYSSAQRTLQVDDWTALIGPNDVHYNPSDPCGGKGYAADKGLSAILNAPRVCQFGRPRVLQPSKKGICLQGYVPQKQGNAVVCAADTSIMDPFVVSCWTSIFVLFLSTFFKLFGWLINHHKNKISSNCSTSTTGLGGQSINLPTSTVEML